MYLHSNSSLNFVTPLLVCVFFLFFFFSSRRRHTRCGRDWSSDVCSSDLILITRLPTRTTARATRLALERAIRIARSVRQSTRPTLTLAQRRLPLISRPRSEERRVGKECRSRWSAEHEKREE